VKRFLLALSLLFATPCWAQSTADLFGAGKGLEMVGGVLVQAVGAVQLCGLGDEAPWRRAVEAINRRQISLMDYAQALGEDTRWIEAPCTDFWPAMKG